MSPECPHNTFNLKHAKYYVKKLSTLNLWSLLDLSTQSFSLKTSGKGLTRGGDWLRTSLRHVHYTLLNNKPQKNVSSFDRAVIIATSNLFIKTSLLHWKCYLCQWVFQVLAQAFGCLYGFMGQGKRKPGHGLRSSGTCCIWRSISMTLM